MDVKNEKGQAIFEMMVFLPIFIFFFTIIFNVGSAINVSINQQKVTRRYFYYLSKGNSYLPTQSNLKKMKDEGSIKFVGMAFIGYRQKNAEGGESPLAPCFKFNSLFIGESDETCEEPGEGDGDEEGLSSTSFIRVYTGYGVCGESYALRETPHRHWVANFAEEVGDSDPRSQVFGCTIQ